MDVVARQRSDPFGARRHVLAADGPALLVDAAHAPGRLAAEVACEVQHVRAQDPQILAAAAAVLLAAHTDFQDRAELPDSISSLMTGSLGL